MLRAITFVGMVVLATGHGDHGEGHARDHEQATKLTASNWHTVENDHHVWVVKFFSNMCGSCKEWRKQWHVLQSAVDGLHYGEVNVDIKENVGLAKKLGVLQEGIPHVKLFNLARMPVTLMGGGKTVPARELVGQLRKALSSHKAEAGSSGFYLSPTQDSSEL